MNTRALFASAVLACGLALAGPASTQTAIPRSGGHPDISGIWTNATVTRLERDPKYGDRLALTRAEAAEIEGDREQEIAYGNRRTDPSLSTEEVNKTCDVKGFSGVGCGYNAGFTDPGTLVMRVHGEPRTSLITFPADGRMPPRIDGRPNGAGRRVIQSSEEGPAVTQANQNDNPETRSLAERCIMSFGVSGGPVMTPQLYNNTYKIVQGPNAVGIWVEMVHDVRAIRIGGKHRTDGVTPWMGDSIGWWDGDTFVVETTNYNPKQNMRGGDENMKVTERFTRIAADRLLYQFKVEDPTVWAQPWGGEYEFAAAPQIYEYACHEGNYGLEDILAGARAEEAEQAAAR